MERLERAGFGRFDPSNFGLWLNIELVVTSHLGTELTPLTMSSFHFALGDKHREFIEKLTDDDLTFTLNCFTMFAHERRHFHDLLATPYGSMLMRQYTRQTLLSLACYHDICFISEAIAVPLSSWVTNADMFALGHNVPPPSDNLRQLHKSLSVMQEELAFFNKGTIRLPEPFTLVDATAILEGLAILTQEHEVEKHFGPAKMPAFWDTFRDSRVNQKYYSAIALCTDFLGPNVPREFLSYCLLASLCGDFADPNPDRFRYPTDLLINLLLWLQKKCDISAVDNFEHFFIIVDDFFEQTYGGNLQDMVTKAAKANEQVSAAFTEMVEQLEKKFNSYPAFRRVLGVFENFRKVQDPFASNIMIDPLWYVSAAYNESVAALPVPVIFLECTTGLPVDSFLEEFYYIQTETRINLAQFPPAIAQGFKHLADHEGVARAAHIFSPRAHRFQKPSGKYPMRVQFQVPEIDVELWQQVFDDASGTLRFLLEGPDGMVEPLFKTILLGLAIVGVRVYAISGELLPPPIPEDPDDASVAPAFRKLLADSRFREALKTLRARRNCPSM